MGDSRVSYPSACCPGVSRRIVCRIEESYLFNIKVNSRSSRLSVDPFREFSPTRAVWVGIIYTLSLPLPSESPCSIALASTEHHGTYDVMGRL